MTEPSRDLTLMDEPLDLSLQIAVDQMRLTAELALHLFENSPDAILIVAEDGTVALVNRQAEILLGYPRSELKGHGVDVLVPNGLAGRHRDHRASYLEHPQIRPMGVGLDLHARRKNGTSVAVDIMLAPVVLTQGIFTIATIRRRVASA